MRALALLVGLLGGAGLNAEEIALYPTGPSEDSAFLRFVNGSAVPLQLNAANGASLTLSSEQLASDFLTVPANNPIVGQLTHNNQHQALDISVAPGEFATVVALAEGQGVRYATLREQPDDFNALKASLGFYNLAEQCRGASLQAVQPKVDIFKEVPVASVQRRSINPLHLSVQLVCAGVAVGPALDLGALAAGQRYTVFALPAEQGARLLKAEDNLAN